MAFQRILLGAAMVACFFLVWREGERRVRRTPEWSWRPLRAALVPLLVEAALLTLFAGLWFGSLGSGGAVLLFLVLGGLMEIPGRLRAQPAGGLPAGPVLAGIVRIVLAGVILRLLLG